MGHTLPLTPDLAPTMAMPPLLPLEVSSPDEVRLSPALTEGYPSYVYVDPQLAVHGLVSFLMAVCLAACPVRFRTRSDSMLVALSGSRRTCMTMSLVDGWLVAAPTSCDGVKSALVRNFCFCCLVFCFLTFAFLAC